MVNNIIEATILNEKFKGADILLPRIPMIPTDISFEFKRLQFAVRLAFATSVWTKFGKSMLLTWTTLCGLLTGWKTFRFIRLSCTHQTEKQKILYIQKLFNKHNLNEITSFI
jgi:hypothetical protein